MTVFVEVDHVDRIFSLPDGGEYIALKNIDLQIRKGEFISLIGHSGCGKSTLLNMIAGLDRPTAGGIILEGREVTKPGPDRMVVFQNYSLLPWKTVRENIALAVNRVMRHLPKGEQKAIIEYHIDLVGLRPAAHKRPSELSGGMKQRVAIARALAIRPKLLLLDEPFGALDALTRGGLQDQLMQICKDCQVTAVMVTHDVDEALLLSDRIVMLTNGPQAQIGQILESPIPRPRKRMEVVNHPSYYALRNEMIYFLNQQKRDKKAKAKAKTPVVTSSNGLEKASVELGFIPLIDCAPLVVAKEKGLFAQYGLEDVTLSRKPNWKAIASGVATGQLDAAQMLAGMPLAMTLGMDGEAPIPMCSAITLSRNGNAITWSKRLYDRGIRTLEAFRDAIAQDPDKVHTLGMVHPASFHNLILRYWLASSGIDPDWDVSLTVIPPAQMVANLKAGNIDGYCVGEPWNSRAVHENIGVVVATDLDLFPGHIEKVLGVTDQWAAKHPKTHLALVTALLEACQYCDDPRNRPEIAEILSRPEYLGTPIEHIRPGFIDPYDRGLGTSLETLHNYNQFYFDRSNFPDRQQMLWMMAEMARWGITPFPKNWVEILQRVCRVDVFVEAARSLGVLDVEPNRTPIQLFDGTIFNPDDPISYLNHHAIKRDVRVEEICLLPV